MMDRCVPRIVPIAEERLGLPCGVCGGYEDEHDDEPTPSFVWDGIEYPEHEYTAVLTETYESDGGTLPD